MPNHGRDVSRIAETFTAVPRGRCYVMNAPHLLVTRKRVRRVMLSRLFSLDIGIEHGYTRRTDDSHVEIVLVTLPTDNGYDMMSKSIRYLMEEWKMQRDDFTVVESTENHYVRLLDIDFCNVKSDYDSEKQIDLGVAHISVKSAKSLPGDDDRVPSGSVSPSGVPKTK